jgi:hypothetical protein
MPTFSAEMLNRRRPLAANMEAASNKTNPWAYPDPANAAGSPNIPVPTHVLARFMAQERTDAPPPSLDLESCDPCLGEYFVSSISSLAQNFKQLSSFRSNIVNRRCRSGLVDPVGCFMDGSLNDTELDHPLLKKSRMAFFGMRFPWEDSNCSGPPDRTVRTLDDRSFISERRSVLAFV